jgi:hypothetical protein
MVSVCKRVNVLLTRLRARPDRCRNGHLGQPLGISKVIVLWRLSGGPRVDSKRLLRASRYVVWQCLNAGRDPALHLFRNGLISTVVGHGG